MFAEDDKSNGESADKKYGGYLSPRPLPGFPKRVLDKSELSDTVPAPTVPESEEDQAHVRSALDDLLGISVVPPKFALKRPTGNSLVGKRLAEETGGVGTGAGTGTGSTTSGIGRMTENSLGSANPSTVCSSMSSEELGGSSTEVGLPVGVSRNFTLSPETTECEPSEVDSEISITSLHSSGKVGMPVLEDGLSSGDEEEEEQQPQSPPDQVPVAENLVQFSSSSSTRNPLSLPHQATLQESPTRAAIQRQMNALEQEVQAKAALRNKRDIEELLIPGLAVLGESQALTTIFHYLPLLPTSFSYSSVLSYIPSHSIFSLE